MLLGDLIGADGLVMHEANCSIPALRTCHSRRLGSGRCEPTLSMKAFPRPVELLLQLISQGHSGQQLAYGGDALTHVLLEDSHSVMHLSVTSSDHQEHEQEGASTHMLTQRVDQIGMGAGEAGISLEWTQHSRGLRKGDQTTAGIARHGHGGSRCLLREGRSLSRNLD